MRSDGDFQDRERASSTNMAWIVRPQDVRTTAKKRSLRGAAIAPEEQPISPQIAGAVRFRPPLWMPSRSRSFFQQPNLYNGWPWPTPGRGDGARQHGSPDSQTIEVIFAPPR